MFILPFFVPAARFYGAYKSTRYELPLDQSSLSTTFNAPKRIDNGSDEYASPFEYASPLKILTVHEIKTELKPFFDKMGIRNDLIVAEVPNGVCFCSSKGTNFFTKGDAVICLTPVIFTIDTDLCKWLMKHEISHIKNNDHFKVRLVPAICSLAAATFSTFLMPAFPALLVTITINAIAIVIFSQYCERRADDFAIAESTPEELKAGQRYIQSVQLVQRTLYRSLLGQILYDSNGESRFNVASPSLASRLKKVDDALLSQNVSNKGVKDFFKMELLITAIFRLYFENWGGASMFSHFLKRLRLWN